MAVTNQLQTISMITTKAARVLSNNLVATQLADREWDSEFSRAGAFIGQTVNVRTPARYTLRTGSVVDIQAQNETFRPLTFVDPVGTDHALTSSELTFSLDDVGNRIIYPAMKRTANGVDALFYGQVNNLFNYVGSPGTALTATTARGAISDAIARLYDNDAPIGEDELHVINGSQFNSTLVQSNASLFNPMKEIGDIYVKGLQGEYGGASVFISQLVPAHTVGTYGGTPLANDATPQVGSSIITDGWTATTTTLNVGDIITFGVVGTATAVYGVNPQTKSPYGWLQPFVVTAQTVTDGSGNSTISLFPAVVASGALQNVSQAIPDEAQITVVGASTSTSQQAIAFHKTAIMYANVDLIVPTGGVEYAAYAKDDQSGVGVRVVRQFDIRVNQHILRLDSMVAFATLYPQLGCRIFTT